MVAKPKKPKPKTKTKKNKPVKTKPAVSKPKKISSKVNRETQLYKQVKQEWELILNGVFLAVDPSVGSTASMPGYALFDKGNLIESGIIRVSPAAKKNVRLFSIAKSLREEFRTPDIIAIENIPPVSFRGGMNGWALVSLQRSIGAILSVFDVPYIEVAPSAWQKYKFEGYEKGDENDAICIGLCVLAAARDYQSFLIKGE
jgi:hypothetical protein